MQDDKTKLKIRLKKRQKIVRFQDPDAKGRFHLNSHNFGALFKLISPTFTETQRLVIALTFQPHYKTVCKWQSMQSLRLRLFSKQCVNFFIVIPSGIEAVKAEMKSRDLIERPSRAKAPLDSSTPLLLAKLVAASVRMTGMVQWGKTKQALFFKEKLKFIRHANYYGATIT